MALSQRILATQFPPRSLPNWLLPGLPGLQGDADGHDAKTQLVAPPHEMWLGPLHPCQSLPRENDPCSDAARGPSMSWDFIL